MSWPEVDWEQERPSSAALALLWRTIEVRSSDDVPPAVEEYLAEVRRVKTNGGALFARFHMKGNADFNWCASRNRWDEVTFFSRFFAHPVVSASLPKVTSGANVNDTVTFEWGSPFLLDSELARILVNGGPYEKFKGTPREAKNPAIHQRRRPGALST